MGRKGEGGGRGKIILKFAAHSAAGARELNRTEKHGNSENRTGNPKTFQQR